MRRECYRVRSPYYVVDRLFAAAELRLGGEKNSMPSRIVSPVFIAAATVPSVSENATPNFPGGITATLITRFRAPGWLVPQLRQVRPIEAGIGR